MKSIKRIIFIIIILVFVTGCTGNANVVVNYDGSVNEKVDINEINGNIIYGNFSVSESLDLFIKKYSKALKVSKYSTSKYNNKYDSGIILEKNYNNICEFANNTIFSQYLYKTIKCEEDDLYYELYNVGDVFQNNYEDYKEMPDDRKFSITLPIQAEEQNADEINGTTYIWKYDKNTKDKDFYLKISKSALKKNEEDYLKAQERKQTMKKLIILGVIVCVIIIIGVIGIVLYKKYKKNKLDY